MLARQMGGELDSWSIRWDYVHFKNDAVAVLPTKSKVLNIGLDGSGVHCRRSSMGQHALKALPSSNFRFPVNVRVDQDIIEQIQVMHRRSLARKAAQQIRRLQKHGLVRMAAERIRRLAGAK